MTGAAGRGGGGRSRGPSRGRGLAALRRALPVALLCALLLSLPPAAAQRGADVEVGMDLYRLVDTHRMTTSDPCGGTFTPDPDGRGFLYEEGDVAGEGMVPGGGYGSSGCGFARIGFQVPAGAASLRVDFLANRQVETFPVDVPGNSSQGVRVRDLESGRLVHQSEYFPADAGSRERQRHAVGPVALPAGSRNLSVEFYFEDQPPLGPDGGTASAFLSGRDFSAHVGDIEVVVRGDLARGVQVLRSDEREGTLLLDEVRVRMTVPGGAVDDGLGGFEAVPRVRVPARFAFESLHLPDGTVVTTARSLDGSLAGGGVLLDRGPEGLDVLVSPGLASEAGPGTYELVLHATQSVRISPALLPLAGLLLALPLPFAVLALVQARVFHREAFGAYRRAARYLMAGVAGMTAYYLFVVLSAFVAGRLDLMAVWPLPLEGWLLYVQVAAAGAAFVVLWLSARALYWITRPRPGTASARPDVPEEDAGEVMEPPPVRPPRDPSEPEEPDAT